MDKKFYSSRYIAGDEYGYGDCNLENFFRIHAVTRWLKKQNDISLLDVGCSRRTSTGCNAAQRSCGILALFCIATNWSVE